MQMSPTDVRVYPRFAYYVRSNFPDVLRVPIIVSAMRRIGQLNYARLAAAVSWGMGPFIKVTPLGGPLGEFTPGVGSNEIRIDHAHVLEFERGRGARVHAAPRSTRLESPFSMNSCTGEMTKTESTDQARKAKSSSEPSMEDSYTSVASGREISGFASTNSSAVPDRSITPMSTE